ncbi:MAG: hypothetical protein PHN88_06760 [Ignavibacteria bacterium]|nr:hypothetical protein [Ignavibacteria bacterium]
MKYKSALTILILCLIFSDTFSQVGIEKTISIPDFDNFPEKNNSSYYINSIRFLLNLNDSLKSVSKIIYYPALCAQYSYVGAFKQSEIIFSTELNVYRKYDDELITLDSYDTLNIYTFLNSIPDSVKYIFFNENHARPQNRMTALNSLDILYKKGFRYLFCEALGNRDSLLNTRKYPIVKSGSYTIEPVFGNLLREAMNLGYTVMPYEDTIKNSAGKLYTNSSRETEQANNILNFISTHRDAKIIVLAGFMHIYESRKLGWMASIFKLKSGFDPLTIEQTEMTEYTGGSYSNDLFKLFRTKYQNKLPVMLINNKTPFSLSPNNYDITIFPAKTEYMNERPDWLMTMSGNKEYKIDMNYWKIKDTCLIQAIIKNEDVQISVPVDQILIENINLKYSLYLKHGSYIIRKINKEGMVEKTAPVDIQ